MWGEIQRKKAILSANELIENFLIKKKKNSNRIRIRKSENSNQIISGENLSIILAVFDPCSPLPLFTNRKCYSMEIFFFFLIFIHSSICLSISFGFFWDEDFRYTIPLCLVSTIEAFFSRLNVTERKREKKFSNH